MVTFDSEQAFWDIASRSWKEAMDRQVINCLREMFFEVPALDRLENEGGKVDANI